MYFHTLTYLLTASILIVNGAQLNSDENTAPRDSSDETVSKNNIKELTTLVPRQPLSTTGLEDEEDTGEVFNSIVPSLILRDFSKLILLPAQKKEDNLVLQLDGFNQDKVKIYFNNDLGPNNIMSPFISEVQIVYKLMNPTRLAHSESDFNVPRLSVADGKRDHLNGRKSLNNIDEFLMEPNFLAKLNKINHPSILNEDGKILNVDYLAKIYPMISSWIASNFLRPLTLLQQPTLPLSKRSIHMPRTYTVLSRQLYGRPIIGGGLIRPQSVAGSSLYGSYAYAHNSPFAGVEPIEGGGEVERPVLEGLETG